MPAKFDVPSCEGKLSVPPIDVQAASQQYFARIHRAALILTGNTWDADDLAQETFLAMADHADQFQGRSNLYTWLYGILLNLDRRRRRRSGLLRKKLRVLWTSEPVRPIVTPAADTALEVAEWKRSLWVHVAQLPDAQREVLFLRFSELLSYQEISDVLACPLGTVKSRIFNGLATLRSMVSMSGDEGALEAPLYPYEDMTHAI